MAGRGVDICAWGVLALLCKVFLAVLCTIILCGFVFVVLCLSGWVEVRVASGRYVGVFLTTFAVSVGVAVWGRVIARLFRG